MLYTLAQYRQYIAQACGIQNTAGAYDFDASTAPTLNLANQMINDSFREICGAQDYTFLETNRSYPFYHIISGVQSVNLYSATSGVTVYASGTITPYPASVLYYTWNSDNSVQDINTNFSGISYVGLSGTTAFSGLSTSGNVTALNWTGVAYNYQLDGDIDKLHAVVIQQPNTSANTATAIILQNADWHDMEKLFPIGTVASSGTPIYYSEFPGLSPTNNKTLAFGPQPDITFSGANFIVHYKKRQEDLINDTDVQNVFPEQWQNVITYQTVEKILDMLQNPKSNIYRAKKQELIDNMNIWDFNQPDKIRFWRDYNERSSFGNGSRSVYDTSSNIFLPR